MASPAPKPAPHPETAGPQANFDMLRPHLKAGGLAVDLLDAWLAEPKTEAPKRMLEALNSFGKPTEDADGPNTTGKA